MTTAYDFETWDVFTGRRFTGNQLAVVTDARGLTDAQMQAVTREFNFAESVFLLPPEDRNHVARVRIFTPGYEMPFAGHPTVGAAASLARSRNQDGVFRLELKAGVFPVEARRSENGGWARFENPNLPRETGHAPAPELIEAALSLRGGALDRDRHRPRRVGAGVDFVYARASLDDVRAAAFDSSSWRALDLDQIVGVLLYAEGGEGADANYHVRMFAPDAGVTEDAATGSAAAALPGQIALADAPADGDVSWVVEQGFEMGRPSRIEIVASFRKGAAARVQVGGDAVFVSRGQIFV